MGWVNISEMLKLPTFKTLSKEINLSQPTICIHEQNGLNKLAEFFINS